VKPRVLVIYNPAAGGRSLRRLARALRRLESMGCAATLRETKARGDAEAIARAASPDETDIVAAAGGDGTANEAANGLAGRELPLAVIPLGTANVLAREIGVADPEAAAEAIALGRVEKVWPGRVGGRRFLMFAGAGLDSHVVHNVSLGLKRRAGRLAYVWETAAAGWRYRFPALQVRVDGSPREAYSVVVSKCSRYAGPYVLAREARLSVPGFQVCLFKRRGLWNICRYSLGLLLSRMRAFRDVEILPAERVSISGPDVPLQVDGDPGGFLPAEISIDREPLSLVVG
jgi:diacylglycerol kinase (ATP)